MRRSLIWLHQLRPELVPLQAPSGHQTVTERSPGGADLTKKALRMMLSA